MKAAKNHDVVGNSAFFSRSEKATLEELDVGDGGKVPRVHGAVAPGKPLVAALEEILKLESLSQVSAPKTPKQSHKILVSGCEKSCLRGMACDQVFHRHNMSSLFSENELKEIPADDCKVD